VGGAETLSKGLCVGHLHTEQRPLILHADVLCAESESEVGQVGEVGEGGFHVEALQLGDNQAEYFVTGSLQLFDNLTFARGI